MFLLLRTLNTHSESQGAGDEYLEGMWLEAHSLASLLPLKSVTNLDYRIHLRSQLILTPLEAGGA